MKITNWHETYHRNGSGGEGFHIGYFHAEGDDGAIDDDFITIMWSGDAAQDVDQATEAAVLRLSDIQGIADWVKEPSKWTPAWSLDLPAWRGTDRFLPYFPSPFTKSPDERRRTLDAMRGGTFGWYEASG